MLKRLKAYLRDRRSRAFMIAESRRLLQELDIGHQAKLSDKAILALTVSFGTAYLQSLVLAKQLGEGAVKTVFMALDGQAQAQKLDG